MFSVSKRICLSASDHGAWRFPSRRHTNAERAHNMYATNFIPSGNEPIAVL